MQGRLNGAGRRIAVVASRFNEEVTERLAAGARACLVQHMTDDDSIDTVWVPGAWELPPTVRRIADAGRYDGIVVVGCVIRGETPHFEYIAGAAANGVAAVARAAEVPVGFGVLTTDTSEQARARAGGKSGNKGWDAARSTLEMIDLYERLETDEA